jgi:hypothetical protein
MKYAAGDSRSYFCGSMAEYSVSVRE